MKLLFDFLPIILFFVAYQAWGIFVATGVAIAVSIALIVWMKLRGRKVDTMQWVSLGLIVVFGGATLIAHNDTFIKWKPTVLYVVMAGALWIARAFFHSNLLQTFMGKQMVLPEAVWTRLNWAWIGFFLFMAALNIYVAYNFPTDLWVKFKLFGGIGLMVIFAIAQSIYLARYMEAAPDAKKEVQ